MTWTDVTHTHTFTVILPAATIFCWAKRAKMRRGWREEGGRGRGQQARKGVREMVEGQEVVRVDLSGREEEEIMSRVLIRVCRWRRSGFLPMKTLSEWVIWRRMMIAMSVRPALLGYVLQ